MKFYLKGVSLRKHDNYTENKKVFILNFSSKVKDTLQNSNIFTKDSILHVCINLIKMYFGQNTEVLINELDHHWVDGIEEKINTIYYAFYHNGQEKVRDEIDKLERYWINWGIYEKNYEKYHDLFQHLIPIEKKYNNIINIINDMNDSFKQIIGDLK